MFQRKKFNLISLLITLGLISMEQVSAKTSGDLEQPKKFVLQLPNVKPDHPEQYLCMARRLPVGYDSQYIVGINPQGDAKKVHHMLMYGCQIPGVMQRDSPNLVWDCGEMQNTADSNTVQSFEKGTACQGKAHILYGWALDAPALKLPEGVGFKVGGLSSDIQFLVVQVHYGHHHNAIVHHIPDIPDHSGLVLDMVPDNEKSGITKEAGVLILISLGQVNEGKSRHEIWCDIEDDIEIHPFSYRVHTHKLGTRVYGAKVSSNSEKLASRERGRSGGKDLIIGTGDPQQPQMFYPVKENITIKKGDSVYASCEFNNNRNHVVKIGATGDDEMCNFYLMYWTNSSRLLTKSQCFGQNPRYSGFLDNLWP